MTDTAHIQCDTAARRNEHVYLPATFLSHSSLPVNHKLGNIKSEVMISTQSREHKAIVI